MEGKGPEPKSAASKIRVWATAQKKRTRGRLPLVRNGKKKGGGVGSDAKAGGGNENRQAGGDKC